MALLHLISHPLCPYVQRAVIALKQKGVEFEITTIDLADKPDWFLDISPLGKTPVLIAEETAIFESAVILEYLEDTQANPLHPRDPLERARHRSWIEFSSSILNDIAGFYSAQDDAGFLAKKEALTAKFQRIEDELGQGPYFDGPNLSLVDAVFGPVFRYFDVLGDIRDFGILSEKPKLAAWRRVLSETYVVKEAVVADYDQRLRNFFVERGSKLSSIIKAQA